MFAQGVLPSLPSSVLLVLVVLLCAEGCPAQRKMQVPPGQSAVVSDKPAGESARPRAKTTPATSRLRLAGASCFRGSQCLSTTCEGASCDGVRPGTCVPEDRICTSDAVKYCGCDGKTFVSSSSCPGESFVNKGSCEDSAEE